MDLLHILTDIPILIVITTFIFAMIYSALKYKMISKNLKILNDFFAMFNKNDLNFRFKEIDEWMCASDYVRNAWLEFKNTLVFSESVALKTKDNELVYQDVSSTIQNIQTTVDPLYFFNEESLVKAKYNSKLIGAMPTILTGLGPMFTFLNIAQAFGRLDFSSQEKILSSVAGLMSTMQVAALVSVFAVCSCLIFTLYDKVVYAKLVSAPLSKTEELIGKLFDNISSEKFLFELLRETKIQNNTISNLIVSLPNQFKVALNAGIASNLVPYLENLIYGINQMNKQLKENAKSGGDGVDDLF